MEVKDKDKKTETDFKGAISLDAILAATSGKTSPKTKETKKQESKAESPPVVETSVKEDSKQIEVSQTSEQASQEETTNVSTEVNGGTQDEVDGTEFFKTALNMISLGVLEDFAIKDPFSEDEDASIMISEFKQMSEANLKELIDIDKQERQKSINSNFISKDGLKEHQLKVIEILKNGGDLSEIAETPDKAFERPFEGFDMDDQQRQIDVLYTDLTTLKGLDHESAITLINREIKSKNLETTSRKIFDAYREAHENYVDAKLEEQRKTKEHNDLNFKENKKVLVAKFKENGFKEGVYKKVGSEYGKKNQSGDYALIDKMREALDNPEENHELILHLTDKNLFNQTFKIKAAQETQKQIIKLASGTSAKGNKKSASTTQNTDVDAPWLRAAQEWNDKIKTQ